MSDTPNSHGRRKKKKTSLYSTIGGKNRYKTIQNITEQKKKKEEQNKKKKRKRKEKEKRRRKKKKKKQPTASHPSVKGQRPQERWIGAHWESQEANPLPSYRPFGFGPHYRLPAF